MWRYYRWVIIVVILLVLAIISDSWLNPRIIISRHFFGKGNYYYGQELRVLDKAVDYYNWSLLFDPKTPYAHYQLARIFLVQNDLRMAKTEIDAELDRHPENKRAYYIKGLIDGYAKDYAEAENDFRKFIEYAPDEWAGYTDLSWVLISDKKFEEAIEVTNRGLQKFPDNLWLFSNRGLALYKIGKHGEARESLEKAKDKAGDLTPDDWRRAYPGNDPGRAEKGVIEVKAIISYNLALVYRNLSETRKYLDEVESYKALFSAGDPMRNRIFDTI